MTEPKVGAVPHLGYPSDCEYLGDWPDPMPEGDLTPARLTPALVATVVFLTAIAPLATDMYVPAFPQVAGELSATATQVQLTLEAASGCALRGEAGASASSAAAVPT